MQIAVGMKQVTVGTDPYSRTHQVFDIDTLNAKLSEGYQIVSNYGDFVLLEKKEDKDE